MIVLIIFIIVSVVALLLNMFVGNMLHYFLGGVMWGLSEIAFLVRSRTRLCGEPIALRRRGWMLAVNVVQIALFLGLLWPLFNDGIVGPKCLDRAAFPGHAIFHILAAVSTFWQALDYANEFRVDL